MTTETKGAQGVLTELFTRRLVSLIERSGKSVTGLSVEMGRPRTWLSRCLLPGGTKQPTALTLDKVDAILVFLDLSHEVLFKPILWPGDQAFLDWIESKDEEESWAEVSDALETFKLEDRLPRLHAEGLVRVHRVPHSKAGPPFLVFNGGAFAETEEVPLSEITRGESQ